MTVTRCIFDVPIAPQELEAGAELPWSQARCWMESSHDDIRALVEKMPWHSRDVPTGEEVVIRERWSGASERFESPDLEVRPTVLVVHALTGDMRAGGNGGWWHPVVGPGKALDTTRSRVLCINNLGSCYGSFGPDDAGFPGRTEDAEVWRGDALTRGGFPLPARALPATITTWDQARFILRTLDALGIERVELLTGGSVGGMICLCLAALAPERFATVAPIAACEAATPWILGWNHIGRMAIVNDLADNGDGIAGLAIARQIAHMTYRAQPGLQSSQGRRMAEGDGWRAALPYRMQTYLTYQGEKLLARFTPAAYLAQLDAMDHHDVHRTPADAMPLVEAARAAGQRWCCIGIQSDQLFFPEHMKELAEKLADANVDAVYREIESPDGHDGFLIEWSQLGDLLATVAPDSPDPC